MCHPTRSSLGLSQNGCFVNSYGALPYVTDAPEFPEATNAGFRVWERMKTHLSVRIADFALY